MKTKHPIFKAYRDGELINRQAFAINPEDGKDSPCIDSKYCDDLRLFTGFEDCHGEPIYEGDTLYRTNLKQGDVWYKGTVKYVSKPPSGCACGFGWSFACNMFDDSCFALSGDSEIDKVSLTPPREERRKNTWPRRSSNRRNRDGLKHFDRRQP